MTKYKNKNENRIDWVDISKGLGIILVIIGHCVYLGGLIHNWIFSFHMPLFFILSGIFIRKIKLNSFIKKTIFKTDYTIYDFLYYWSNINCNHTRMA